DLITDILNDLAAIQAKQTPQLATQSYGKIWANFEKALENEGCEYWAKLYQNIFDNNFELDQVALARRLNVPKEIKEQGAAAVGIYLAALEDQGAERLNEARIIILGEKGAGKTCIARKLIDPDAEMTSPEESTAGVDTTLWSLTDGNLKARIWDFAGHTVTHAVHQFFLSERCLYIIVYDGRTEQRNRLEYWLNHMKNYGGNSTAIILVNERDQHSIDIQINNLREKYPIHAVRTFSVKNDKYKLNAFRDEVARFICDNPCWNKQEIPKSYFNVKEDLEALFNKQDDEQGKEHITKKEFEAIAKSHNVANTDRLLKDLHALGVSLWYDEMEDFDT
ncbi:MAG: ADP-ribosylation factor-like protein, partial [Psychrosphaera sp.]|nr:ADP-ribosylation factor-like protein [Psychrosphaera sp.]